MYDNVVSDRKHRKDHKHGVWGWWMMMLSPNNLLESFHDNQSTPIVEPNNEDESGKSFYTEECDEGPTSSIENYNKYYNIPRP